MTTNEYLLATARVIPGFKATLHVDADGGESDQYTNGKRIVRVVKPAGRERWYVTEQGEADHTFKDYREVMLYVFGRLMFD